jgi:hypothetical protein
MFMDSFVNWNILAKPKLHLKGRVYYFSGHWAWLFDPKKYVRTEQSEVYIFEILSVQVYLKEACPLSSTIHRGEWRETVPLTLSRL